MGNVLRVSDKPAIWYVFHRVCARMRCGAVQLELRDVSEVDSQLRPGHAKFPCSPIQVLLSDMIQVARNRILSRLLVLAHKRRTYPDQMVL